MDVSTMDPASAKLTLELEVADLIEMAAALADADAPDAQLQGLEVYRGALENQLEVVEGQIVAEAEQEDDRRKSPAKGSQAGRSEAIAEDLDGKTLTVENGYETEGDEIKDEQDEQDEVEEEDDDARSSPAATPTNNTFVECPNCYNEWREDEQPAQCPTCGTDSMLFEDVFSSDGSEDNSDSSDSSDDDSATIVSTSDDAKKTDTKGKGKAEEPVEPVGERIVCIACQDMVPIANTLTLGCEPEPHTYCHACLLDLIEGAIHTDTSLFPPRCCKNPIPLDMCRAIIPAGQLEEFNLKVEQLSEPNPTDCHSCTKFIRADNITDDVATCAYCDAKTCIACKKRAHTGLCDEDPHVKLFKDMAGRSKWQKCSQCGNMVELTVGCFHMICRCHNQFCYLCGKAWKTCRCPQVDEDHLYYPRRGQLAQKEHVKVEAGSSCEEHLWVRRPDGACHQCKANFLPFVMQCEKCETQACWRCIKNRA